MLTRFPVELWVRVASVVNRSDLMNLALVSRFHLDVFRRVFCRAISLDSGRFRQSESGEYDIHEIRNYLVKYNLGSVVQELVVWGYETRCTVYKLLKVTPALRSLSMVLSGRQVFLASAKAQRKFVELVKTSCTGLEAFRINGSAYLKDENFAIPNIKAIKWKEFGRVSLAFISICKASCLTLTEISLAIYDGAYSEFFRILFPHLLIFKIGPGSDRYGRNASRTKAISSGLTSFLVAHPTIENLNLVYRSFSYTFIDAYISLQPELLTQDMLHKLKILCAHPNQVSQIATTMPRFLPSLETLRLSDQIFSKRDESAHNFSDMVQKLVAKGPLSVRHLFFDLLDAGNRVEDFVSNMGNVASAFPALETWQGNSPGWFNTAQVADIFAQFLRLRVISYNVVSSSKEQVTEEQLKIVAERCPLLERFLWRGTRPPTQFTVTRPHRQIVINSAPLLVDEGVWVDRYDYHADSDAENDEWGSDYDGGRGGDDSSDDGDDDNGDSNLKKRVKRGSIGDNDHDFSDAFESAQESEEGGSEDGDQLE